VSRGAILLGALLAAAPARADGIDTEGQAPHERCATCHELDGNARQERLPRLAGQPVDHLVKQLQDFRDGRRVSAMQATAELLSDEEIAEAARHFSGQRPGPPAAGSPPSERRLAERLFRRGDRKRGLQACGSCHGAQGEGEGARPRLAGQHAAYVEAQLLRFRQGERANDDGVMQAVVAAISEPEIQALARYVETLGSPTAKSPRR
jgi:cytochrome c553